jgi:glycosyltransferase involved in cell wall biosynthesis
MAGIFARDQARALAHVRPDWRISVSTWGHHDGALALRSAASTLRAARWRWTATSAHRRDGPLHLWQEPRLTWTLAWRGGGAAGLLSACRANLARAERALGRVDVLHAHVGFPAGWIAAQLAQGRPWLLTEHMSPFPFPALQDARGAPTAALRYAYANATQRVAVGRALAAQIESHGLGPVGVLPNAVDALRFTAVAAPPGGAPTLLVIAALEARKGIDLLLRAMARVPVWRLRIAGQGSQLATLKDLAHQLGLSERVQWLGGLHPRDVPAALAQCHALVLPSHAETFGVVLVEAWMAGRPVLATRCGGPDDLVKPGLGLLVPPGDVAALAEGLNALYAALPEFEASALRAHAEQYYGLSAVGERLAQTLERLR